MTYFLLVVLISRLIFIFDDGPLNGKRWVMMTVIQIMGLFVFIPQAALFIAVGVLILLNLLFFRIEKRRKKTNSTRLLLLAIQLVLISILFSNWVNPQVQSGVMESIKWLATYSQVFLIIRMANWSWWGPVLVGLIFVSNEANLLIRFMFERFNLVPDLGKPQEKNLIRMVDQREYNAGRVIGILERIFVYYFLLNGHLTAIGFIIAAKSFARFKDLDNRVFAEYVLIGTLLSVLSALIAGGLVLFMLP